MGFEYWIFFVFEKLVFVVMREFVEEEDWEENGGWFWVENIMDLVIEVIFLFEFFWLFVIFMFEFLLFEWERCFDVGWLVVEEDVIVVCWFKCVVKVDLVVCENNFFFWNWNDGGWKGGFIIIFFSVIN